ncbi:MAG: type II toxin-antitoxin system RelE/ParE family toxin [Bacteroidia bacterium]
MPREVELAPEAVEDVRIILSHILEEWSVQQYQRYHKALEDAIDHIAEQPDSWRSRKRDNILEGVRSITVGNHFVYYRVKDNKLQVIRILHEGLDPEEEFKDK